VIGHFALSMLAIMLPLANIYITIAARVRSMAVLFAV